MNKIKSSILLALKKLYNLVNRLQVRIFLLLNITIIVAVSLVSFICFKTFEKTLVEQIGYNRVDVLRQIGERVKIVKDSASTLSNLYYYDNKLNLFMHSDGSYSDEITTYLKEVTEKYKIAFNEVDMDYYVNIFGENGYNYSEDVTQDKYNHPKKEIWYKNVFLNNGKIFWVSSYRDKQRKENVFCAARTLQNYDGKQKGILLINVNEKLLSQTYTNSLTKTNTVYVVDEKGSILSSNNKSMLGFNFFHISRLRNLFAEKPYTIINISGRKVLFTGYKEEGTGWTMLEEIPFEEVITPIIKIKYITITVTFAIIFLGSIIAYNFSKQVANPIKELCYLLQNIKDENFESEYEIKGWYEINVLNKGLNSMLKRIKNLLESIKQEEKQKRKLELGFLQAQINPHFMYNTLFSIKCMVDMEKNKEATKMLSSFIQLLKNTLSNPNEFLTLEEEFEILKQYCLLQQMRYDGQFNINYIYKDDVLNYRIPKLLIQPLVENALFHGIEIKKEKGCISVSAYEDNGNLYVIVEDNGVGITKALKEKLENDEAVNFENHIGISNVKERIHLNFGNKYGLKIESKEWKGTRVILTLPAIE
ncbi:MAG: sensor histidine kinase [Lachnospirales bacterium]